MAAKPTPARGKGRKASEPTPIKDVIKAKKPVPTKAKTDTPVAAKKATAKTSVKKKSTRKKPAPKKTVLTEKDFEQFFYKLSLDDFVEYAKVWNETQLKIKIPKLDTYDAWLNYFKKLSPSALRQLVVSGLDFLPTEAYAALSRWHDIISHPSRIDKIHQAGLTGSPDKKKKSITELARNNDRMGVLMAVRDQLAEQMEKRASPRDMASLAREMGDILDQIAELEKRKGPKKGSKVAELLGEFNVRSKRPSANGGGARHTSFKSRITVKDKEAKHAS